MSAMSLVKACIPFESYQTLIIFITPGELSFFNIFAANCTHTDYLYLCTLKKKFLLNYSAIFNTHGTFLNFLHKNNDNKLRN